MRYFLISLLMAFSLLASACVPSKETWHQKLSLHIETPNGEIIASSVMGIRVDDASGTPFDLSGIGPLSFTEQGEAVVADLEQGRYLFALLTGSPDGLQGQTREAYRDVYDAHTKKGKAWYAKWIRAVKAEKEPRVLPPHAYPMLVSFADINDPKTVFEVDPSDLAASFGEGFALKLMILQVTDEAVTKGSVEPYLPWLRNIWPNRLDGQRYGNRESKLKLANSLSSGNFATGVLK